jgi:hypothetical protein
VLDCCSSTTLGLWQVEGSQVPWSIAIQCYGNYWEDNTLWGISGVAMDQAWGLGGIAGVTVGSGSRWYRPHTYGTAWNRCLIGEAGRTGPPLHCLFHHGLPFQSCNGGLGNHPFQHCLTRSTTVKQHPTPQRTCPDCCLGPDGCQRGQQSQGQQQHAHSPLPGGRRRASGACHSGRGGQPWRCGVLQSTG